MIIIIPYHVTLGHVTVGGSVCMQMLTRSGWSPSNDIEASNINRHGHNISHAYFVINREF